MLKKADNNSSSVLKVLHVIPSVAPSRGGPSKAVIEMVSALNELGVDAEIATTDDNAEKSLNVTLNTLISHQTVPLRFFKRARSKVSAIQEFGYSRPFRRWLKENIDDYDVVHVHAIFSYVSTYAMWLARKRNIPYVVRPIGQLEDWSLSQSKNKKEWYLKLVEQSNLEGASAVHFTAESEKRQALKRFPSLRSNVIPLGINKSKSRLDNVHHTWALTKNTPVICYLSRLHPKKGLELLLQALSSMNNTDFQLIIAGTGEADYEASLKERVITLKLEEKCHFIGFIEGDEKQHLLQSSDIFALTSYSENFGVAVLEAMAAGAMPFISKEVALSNVVEEHQLGVVCKLSIEDIKHKLGTQLQNIEASKVRGTAAKRFVEQHYQWPAIAQQLKDLYLQIKHKS